MKLRFVWMALLLCVPACNGGSTAGPPIPAATNKTPTGPTGTARITITIPLTSASAQARKTQSYISAKTKSVGVFVTTVNGTPPSPPISAIVDTGGTASACTTGPGGITCVLPIVVPVGNDTLSVRTYAATGGQGQPISIGTATANVIAGQTVDAPTNLLPVVTTYSAAATPNKLPIGTPGTFTLSITAKDSAGDDIGGTDPYYLPITVQSPDTSGHVTAVPALPASITGPGQIIKFSYDGKGTAATFIFTIAGTTDAIATGAPATTAAVSFGGGQHLYVASQSANEIFVYDIGADGSITPSYTLSGAATTIAKPTAIAVDNLGTLYVVNYDRNVTVYLPGASGNSAPWQTFADAVHPEFIAINGNGVVFGGPQPSTSGGTGLDTSLETVYIATVYPSGAPPGSARVFNTPFIVPFSNSWSNSPVPNSTGFSVLSCAGQVTPYDNGTGSVLCYPNPIPLVTSGPNTYASGGFNFPEAPGGLAFRPDGLLTVAAHPIYSRSAQINTYSLPAASTTNSIYLTPTYSIVGSATGLQYPTGVAFDKLGNLYVSDYGQASGAGTVKQWPINATGNVAPARTVSGFDSNFSIAIGP